MNNKRACVAKHFGHHAGCTSSQLEQAVDFEASCKKRQFPCSETLLASCWSRESGHTPSKVRIFRLSQMLLEVQKCPALLNLQGATAEGMQHAVCSASVCRSDCWCTAGCFPDLKHHPRVFKILISVNFKPCIIWRQR